MFAKLKAWWESLWIKPVTIAKDITTQDKPPEAHITPWRIPSFKIQSSRKLATDLESLIDNKLMEIMPAKFKAACLSKDANALVGMCAEALSALKIREKTGNNDGYLVELIQRVGGGVRGYAWCMYSVQTSVAYAEIKTGIKSKLYTSGSCAEVRQMSSGMAIDYTKSQYGDIWIWIYHTGLGHTGVFEHWITKNKVATLNEGNTTKGLVDGKIVREGGGQYETERTVVLDKNAYMRLGMVIRPF